MVTNWDIHLIQVYVIHKVSISKEYEAELSPRQEVTERSKRGKSIIQFVKSNL